MQYVNNSTQNHTQTSMSFGSFLSMECLFRSNNDVLFIDNPTNADLLLIKHYNRTALAFVIDSDCSIIQTSDTAKHITLNHAIGIMVHIIIKSNIIASVHLF